MLELPESRCLADQFKNVLQGKIIAHVAANKSPHKFAWFHGDPQEYESILQGKAVTGADAFGGIAELQIEDRKLAFCDGTNVRFFEAGSVLPPKHQLQILFGDGSSLICSVQMYGAMWLLDHTEEEGYYKSSKYKIKPLQPEFDFAYFNALRAVVKPNLSVKAFLATEQRIPGLGNGVLQDILFNARIHPRRKISSLSAAELEGLFRSVRQTLQAMTAQGGRDTEKDLFGRPGGYRTQLSAKTKAQPCPECGAQIVREAYLGGNIYYCPVCQPLS